jgi:hypothetical protein
MKAVVVEIRNNKAAVLSDNGCVVTVKNNGYEIGQVIHMIDSKKQFTKKIAVFAASAAAFVVLGTGAWAYATPYSYVSMDVNPSIEYTVNRFDRVLTVKAINDDGEEILKAITLEDLENKTIEDAILKTVDQITAAGYFNTTAEGGIVITTASENMDKADELATDLQQVVEEEIAEVKEDIIVEAYSVGLERVEEARELGVTPGKLNLVEKLQSSSSDPSSINIEEWLNRSVKDIMKATKDNRKASSVSGSAIAMEEKDTDRAEKEASKEEKREAYNQQKDDQNLQKEESKQQKEELKQQKDDQKEEDKLLKKSKENKKGPTVEAPTTNDDEQKPSESKKDKAVKQSPTNNEKSDSTKDKTLKKIDDATTSTNEKNITNSPDKTNVSSPSDEDKEKDDNSSDFKKNSSDVIDKKGSTSDLTDDLIDNTIEDNEEVSNINPSDDNRSNEDSGNSNNNVDSNNSGNSGSDNPSNSNGRK